jgi:hypothetical protein
MGALPFQAHSSLSLKCRQDKSSNFKENLPKTGPSTCFGARTRSEAGSAPLEVSSYAQQERICHRLFWWTSLFPSSHHSCMINANQKAKASCCL